MSDKHMTVYVENDNSGCLWVIAVILVLILLEVGSIDKFLQDNFGNKPQTETETVQTNEVQE